MKRRLLEVAILTANRNFMIMHENSLFFAMTLVDWEVGLFVAKDTY